MIINRWNILSKEESCEELCEQISLQITFLIIHSTYFLIQHPFQKLCTLWRYHLKRISFISSEQDSVLSILLYHRICARFVFLRECFHYLYILFPQSQPVFVYNTCCRNIFINHCAHNILVISCNHHSFKLVMTTFFSGDRTKMADTTVSCDLHWIFFQQDAEVAPTFCLLLLAIPWLILDTLHSET